MRMLTRMLSASACCAALLAPAGQAVAGPAPSAERRPALPIVQSVRPSGQPQPGGLPKAAPAPAPVETAVTVDQLRLLLREFLERRYRDKVAEVEVAVLSPDEAVTVPAGRLDTRVRPRGIQEALGRRLFEVAFLLEGKEVRTVRVLAEVTMQADVLTVTRSIRPEETLEAEDLKVSRVTLPSAGHDFVTDLEQAVGKRVIRPLREESPIKLSSLALPEVVQKGDQVTIEVKHGGLLIQANGTSKSGGSIGQSITVLNQDSKKEVRAKVVGPGTVRVEF